MLKIQRKANGDVVFTVVGRLEPDNVGELLRAARGGTGRPGPSCWTLRTWFSSIVKPSVSCAGAKVRALCFATVRRTSGPGWRAGKSMPNKGWASALSNGAKE